jgi:hypothetical protein
LTFPKVDAKTVCSTLNFSDMTNHRIGLFLLSILAFLGLLGTSGIAPLPAEEPEWKIGLAQVKITPEKPVFSVETVRRVCYPSHLKT